MWLEYVPYLPTLGAVSKYDASLASQFPADLFAPIIFSKFTIQDIDCRCRGIDPLKEGRRFQSLYC
jgi:hypothetical protein